MSHTDKMRDLLDRMDGPQQLNEGYRILPNIDRDRYGDREHEGLEGPINANGRALYYDPREGRYYDPNTDMYLSHEEALGALSEGSRFSGLKRGDLVIVKARGPYYGETGQVMALGDGGRHVVGGRVGGDQVVVEFDSGKILAFNTEDLRANDDQLDEISRDTLSSYIRRARNGAQSFDDVPDARKPGVSLALKKKWGGEEYGVPVKVKAADRDSLSEAHEQVVNEIMQKLNESK